MLGGSLGSTKVPEVLVWQGVCPGDRSPVLSFLQKANSKNSRVLQWAMTLQPYRYCINYIPGRENVGADYMRHAVIQNLNQGFG